MLVIVPTSFLLVIYGMSGYAMNASMSVAMNMPAARAAAIARLWLLLIGCSLAVFVTGTIILWRWRRGA